MPVAKVKFHEPGKAPPNPVPLLLLREGPNLPVQIEVPDALAKQLADTGKPIPPPVSGKGLIDTGATFSAVDNATARKLELQPVRVTKVGTASGEVEQPVYSLKLTLPTARIVITDGNVVGADLSGVGGVIVLIGRSFLQHVMMIYDGPSAEFSLAY